MAAFIADARLGWRCPRVTLDGVDVTRRCQGIHFDGERPVAVELFLLDAADQFVVRDRDLVRELHAGEITVTGLTNMAQAAS